MLEMGTNAVVLRLTQGQNVLAHSFLWTRGKQHHQKGQHVDCVHTTQLNGAT